MVKVAHSRQKAAFVKAEIVFFGDGGIEDGRNIGLECRVGWDVY